MNFTKFSIALFIIVGIFSCKTEIKESQKYKDVMAIHDAVMPEISKLQSIKKEFKSYADSSNLETIKNTSTLIVQADDAMMEWMANFKLPSDKSEAATYLDAELPKIQEVANKINEAKAMANKTLEELKASKGQ